MEEVLTAVEVQEDREEGEVEEEVEHRQDQEGEVMVAGEADMGEEEEEGVMEVGADMVEEEGVVEAASQVEIEEVDMEVEAVVLAEETETEGLVLDQVEAEEGQVLAEVLEEMGKEMEFTADQLQEEVLHHHLIQATVTSHQEGGAHQGGKLMTITMTTRRTHRNEYWVRR